MCAESGAGPLTDEQAMLMTGARKDCERHPHVLLVDEVGHLACGDDAANLLFHVVKERHLKHRSMIFTTSKSLDAWGAVLHDGDLAAAIVDRILERGRHLKRPARTWRDYVLEKATSSTSPGRSFGRCSIAPDRAHALAALVEYCYW